jgi:hypothetical protein
MISIDETGQESILLAGILGGLTVGNPFKIPLEPSPRFCQAGKMLRLPFLTRQNRADLILGRLGNSRFSPLFRVTSSERTAHLYVIGVSGKGKSKLLEYCLYQAEITV